MKGSVYRNTNSIAPMKLLQTWTTTVRSLPWLHRQLSAAFGLTAICLSAGCSHSGGEKFDAYDPSGVLDANADFQSLDIRKEIPPEMLKPVKDRYRVGPGDILDVEVAENTKTRANTTIMPDGMLYFDVSDGIRAKGKTLAEVSKELSAKLTDHYPSPVVTVNLVQAESHQFWILGQVKKPGAYPLNRPIRLVEAISMAGGLYSAQYYSEDIQETVDLDRAILIRGGDLVPVDFRALIEGGAMQQNVYIRPGDYLYLPSVQHRAVYVLGAVSNPGPVYFDNDPTVISALASVGGHRPDAIITKALIIRGSLQTPRVAVINIRDIMKGRDRDVRLVAGDIVWVPNTVWTYLRDYVEGVAVTAAQAVAVQEGLGVMGVPVGGANVTISAGGQ